MLNILLLLLALAATPQIDAFKKEASGLQSAIDQIVNNSIPGPGMLQKAKATYLEGFGVVVTVEVALEPPPNPFSNPKSPEELRRVVNQRSGLIRSKFQDLVKQRIVTLQSVGPTESLAVVLHLFNPHPAALPAMPGQIVFTAKKQDPSNVAIREY